MSARSRHHVRTDEEIARAFHETYERLAPIYGYRTRQPSRKPWAEVPENNRRLMMATVAALCHAGFISRPIVDQ